MVATASSARASTERRASRPPTPAGSATAGGARASSSPGPGEGYSSRARPSGRVSVDRRQESGCGVHTARFDLRESALCNASVAREVTKMVLLPRDVEERERVSVGDVLEETFPHLIHLVHDIVAMRAAVTRYAEMSASLQHNLKEAEDKLAGSDRRARQLASSEGKLKEEVSKLRQESTALKEVSGGLQSSMERKDAELNKLRRLVSDQSAENEGLQRLREQAEKRAQEAEDKALSAENNREMEVAIATSRAVEDYKSSAAFETDASAACLDFYKYGYADCLKKATEAFPGLDVARIALPEGEEEGELPEPGRDDETAARSDAQEPIVIESPENAPARE